MHAIGLTHVSGVFAKVVPPVAETYMLAGNDKDWEAKLASDNSAVELSCWRIFQAAGKLDALPRFLPDERVGQASDVAVAAQPKTLALANKVHNADGLVAVLEAEFLSSSGGNAPAPPSGGGGGAFPRSVSPGKRRRLAIGS